MVMFLMVFFLVNNSVRGSAPFTEAMIHAYRYTIVKKKRPPTQF